MQKVFDCQKAIKKMDPGWFAKLVVIGLGFNMKGKPVNNAITDVSFLKKCGLMEKLYIYWTKTTYLPLGNAVKLKYIWISSCKTLQNINGLEGCSELEEIEIRYLNITSIAVIGKLQNLKKVQIQYCEQITDYDVLEGCTGLTYLYIYRTNISDISPIANLKNLETLDLKENNQLPEQFRKNIYNNKQEVGQFLNKCKQTQQYKDYKLKPKYHQLRVSLIQTHTTVSQYKNKINKMIYQYKVNLVKSLEKIIEYQ